MRAGDDLNERAFARAVFAEQGVDLAGLKIEIHAAKRTHATVVFYELAECEEGGKGHAGLESGRRMRGRTAVK